MKKFTLDYVCMDVRGMKKVVSASILDIGDVIESDHVSIRVEIEWKRVMGQRKKKRKAPKKRCPDQTEMGSLWQTDKFEEV